MDYLDPQKRFRQKILMLVGYALIAVAIAGGIYTLLFFAYGYDISKNGQVIQKGVVFVSSQPNPAQIYLDGKPSGAATNTKLLLAAGRYTLQLRRTGYRPWQRSITVEGGDVQHFDYPLLFPQALTTTALHSYAAAPPLASQSPDRRWLVVAQPDTEGIFDLYDLASAAPEKSVQVLTLPDTVYTKSSNDQGWQAVAWADDNQHLLLKHSFEGKSEYIELDRQDPTQSLNLDSSLAVSAVDINFRNQKYNQFYIYSATDHSLQTDALNSPTPTPFLTQVLSYTPYGSDTVLYATDTDAPAGQAAIKMQVGDKTYPLRTVPASQTYVLEAAGYNGPLYVAVGGSADNKVYLYQDPAGQEQAHPAHPALAMRALKINAPSYVAFSTTAQFIMAENGSATVVYDLENSRSYTYTLKAPLDAPQTHVSWMDGNRLAYVSGGKLVVLDYDNTNVQSLVPLAPAYSPYFAPDFQHVYALAPAAKAPAIDLAATPLVVP